MSRAARARSWALSLAACAGLAAAAHAQPALRPELPAAEAPADALAKLLARTDAVAREVARVRGLPLRRPIPNDVVDREELRRRLIVMAAEDKTKAETSAEGLALARWGMIPLATDYEALLIELLTEQIAGYYDPDTRKLTISKSAGDDAQWAELVLAHEIDHGLQDQAFDLKKFEDVPDSEDDARAARRALVEGDGVALMLEVMLARRGVAVPWSNPQVTDAVEKAMVTPGNDGLDQAPLAIREAMIFPYRAGFTFVAALRRRQPWSAVDAAFARPPRSTEQILHPERYLADDRPISIEVAAPAVAARLHGRARDGVGRARLRAVPARPRRRRGDRGAGGGGLGRRSRDRARPRRRPAAGARGRHLAQRVGQRGRRDRGRTRPPSRRSTRRSSARSSSTTRTRTRWFGIDGTVSWVERRGPSIAIVLGAPAWAASALAAEVWAGSRIAPAGAPKAAKAPKR